MGIYLSDQGAHVDRPLTNIAIKAFNGEGDFDFVNALFPLVPVDKQSDSYYIIDPDNWLRVENTYRAPMTGANFGEWQVSSDNYFCHNYAFRGKNPKERLSNADMALQIRTNTTLYVQNMLKRDRAVRVAGIVTSVSNVGSGVLLTATSGAAWCFASSSNPLGDINTAHAFIESRTGHKPNVAVLDADTARVLRIHPDILDVYKYTTTGLKNEEALKSLLADILDVQRVFITRGIKNTAKEGATRVTANIWGANCLLARVENAAGLQTATFGLTPTWQPEGFPGMMAVERYDDADKSKKLEWIEAQYFANEKVVARDLAYLIGGTIG